MHASETWLGATRGGFAIATCETVVEFISPVKLAIRRHAEVQEGRCSRAMLVSPIPLAKHACFPII